MSINIHCPNCNQGYSVSEEMVGRSIICKKCDNMFTVENIPDIDNVEVVEDDVQEQNFQQNQYQAPQMQPPPMQQPPPYQNPQYQQGQYPPPPPAPQQFGQDGRPPYARRYNNYPPQQQHYNQYPPMHRPVEVANNLIWAIIAAIFFWPTGIPAIVNSVKVDKLAFQGDYQGAKEAADRSRKWTLISVVLGVAWLIIYFTMIFNGVMSNGMYPY